MTKIPSHKPLSLEVQRTHEVAKAPEVLKEYETEESLYIEGTEGTSHLLVESHTKDEALESAGPEKRWSVLGMLLYRSTSHSTEDNLTLEITDTEKQLVQEGDLKGFWKSRLGKDPVARIGLAIWGSEADLKEAIEQSPSNDWKPHVNPISAIAIRLRAPGDVPVIPQDKDELLQYWTWLGQDARDKVTEHLVEEGGLSRNHPDMPATLRNIGVRLAEAHVDAVESDLTNDTGETSGLLSREQIKDYHHKVFAEFSLSPETYGGTPLKWVPDFVELWLGGGLYAPDADPSARS